MCTRVPPRGSGFFCLAISLALAAASFPARAQDADGVHELGKIQVEATEDTAVTEDTGSYTTTKITIGKTALSLREIPQSVSVLTRQRLDDQNFTTLGEALDQTVGVDSADPNGLGFFDLYSRGGQLAQQYDGVPGNSIFHFSQEFDLAIYDRVEVLRGPAGLLQGAGNSTGVANMVRKRPRSDTAIRAGVLAGSWDNYHADLDVTGALNRSGTIRARAVVAGVDRDFYYDVATQQGWTGYGILEADPTSSTTVGVSFGVQRADITPFNGLPGYTTGAFLDLPRSTYLDPTWSNFQRDIRETVVDVRQRLGRTWLVKGAVRRRHLETEQRNSITRAPIDPATMRTTFQLTNGRFDTDGTGFDVNVAGPLRLFGRRHELLAGYNIDVIDTESASANLSLTNRDLFNPGIDESMLPPITGATGTRIVQSGVYGMARIRPVEALTVIIGGRASDYTNETRTVAPVPTPWVESAARARGELTPYGGVIWDVTRRASVYASYADTFVPQTQMDYLGNIIDPRVGWQVETGIKGDLVDDRLQASVALFRIRDRNRAMIDPDHVGCGTSPTSNCYLAAGLVQSQGWEMEVTGTPLRSWQVSVGYTDNDNKYLRDSNSMYNGNEFWTYSPARVLKLWSNYRFDELLAGTPLARLTVGLGLRSQSRIYTNITYTVSGNTGLEQRAYTVADLQAGYWLTPRLQATVTVNNLTDVVYYRQINDARSFNYYGEPRNVMLTLRARF